MKEYRNSGYTLAELAEWVADYAQMKQEAEELESLGSYSGSILAEQTRYRMTLIEKRIKELPFCVERVYLETVVLKGERDPHKIIDAVLPTLNFQALKFFCRYEESKAAKTSGSGEQGVHREAKRTRRE